jgi:hypothetical protein
MQMETKNDYVEERKSATVLVRQEGSELRKEQIVLYSISDIMALFQVCRRTISNWQNSGKLSFIKIGSLLYVTQQQLEEFLQDNTVVGYKRYGR